MLLVTVLSEAKNLFNLSDDPVYEEKGCDYDVSIKELNKQNSILIYPNPASDQLTLDNGQEIMNEIRIFDMLGKEVKHLFTNNTKTTLNINDLNKGFYFLRILTDKGIVNKGFVKE